MQNPTLVKSFDWKNSTPEQRNAACAQFMPPSDLNPLRSFHLFLGAEDEGQLNVTSLEKAIAWLNAVRATKKNWEKYIPQIPWQLAGEVTVKEHTRHVRYTDTPGGAWMLIEELLAKGGIVLIDLQRDTCNITAEPPQPKILTRENMVLGTRFIGSEPFSELAGMVFLTINGVQVKQ